MACAALTAPRRTGWSGRERCHRRWQQLGAFVRELPPSLGQRERQAADLGLANDLLTAGMSRYLAELTLTRAGSEPTIRRSGGNRPVTANCASGGPGTCAWREGRSRMRHG